MFFGNNSSAMRRIQYSMIGLLLRTTKSIHMTHGHTQILGVTPPIGGGSAFLFFCHHFCYARVQTKLFDLQIVRQDVGLMAMGSSQHVNTFSARSQVVSWGLDLGGKISPSEINGKNCNPNISETLYGAKRSKNSNRPSTNHYGGDHQCARRRDSSYAVWSRLAVVYLSDWPFR